jgi:hypothetical protein
MSISCNAGFADVDGNFNDGCEVNLNTDPANCGTVGHRIPSNGTLNANWACSAGVAALIGCSSGFFDANSSIVDGCEFHQDPAEPNDTRAGARFLSSMSIGSTSTFTANLTPNNDDWYVFTTNGCSVFTPCNVTVTARSGLPAGALTFIRDTNAAVLASGDVDVVTTNHQYFIHITADTSYVPSYWVDFGIN